MRVGNKFPFASLSGKASAARCQDEVLQIREKSWPWPRGLPAAAPFIYVIMHSLHQGSKCPPEVVERMRSVGSDRQGIAEMFSVWMNASEDWASSTLVVSTRSTSSTMREKLWIWMSHEAGSLE